MDCLEAIKAHERAVAAQRLREAIGRIPMTPTMEWDDRMPLIRFKVMGPFLPVLRMSGVVVHGVS